MRPKRGFVLKNEKNVYNPWFVSLKCCFDFFIRNSVLPKDGTHLLRRLSDNPIWYQLSKQKEKMYIWENPCFIREILKNTFFVHKKG